MMQLVTHGARVMWCCVVVVAAMMGPAMAQAGPWPNCSSAGFQKQAVYSVSVTERDPVPHNAALVSHVNGSSEFNFSFTTAWFPAPKPDPTGGGEGLIIRVVECNPNHHSCDGVPHPQWTNAGALAVVSASLPADGVPKINERVTTANIQWPGCSGPPQSQTAEWGAADPRLTYRPKTNTYVEHNCNTHSYPPTHLHTLAHTHTHTDLLLSLYVSLHTRKVSIGVHGQGIHRLSIPLLSLPVYEHHHDTHL